MLSIYKSMLRIIPGAASTCPQECCEDHDLLCFQEQEHLVNLHFVNFHLVNLTFPQLLDLGNLHLSNLYFVN